MLTCFDDTRTVMKNAFENMNPGGWIEFQDTAMEFYQANELYPGSHSPSPVHLLNANLAVGNAFQRWAEGCNQGLAAIGRDGKKAWKYKEWLEEIGCKAITTLWHTSSASYNHIQLEELTYGTKLSM